MSGSGGRSNAVPTTSAGEPTELQLTADRVASGVNLLRWALITVFAVNVVSFAVPFVVTAAARGLVDLAWIMFVVRIIAWARAPLALLGILRILRARDWPAPRWLLRSLVIYFAADSMLTPANSVYSLLSRLGIGEGVMPAIDVALTIISLLLSLLYFAVLFGGFHLARAVDTCFDGSLLSRRHLGWLLWIGIALHSAMLVWWAVLRIWDPLTSLRDMGYDETTGEMIVIAIPMLLVGLPYAAWLIWLLVVAFRIGRKLKRFAKRNRCPRCDYYLHDAVERGCPECGWMRGPDPPANAETV